ncbi:MAG: hypothetical protein EXS13_05465 [Planctomycetes bacterium]|nr:hypothetical protein [Planctomycetota bacterium]
MSRRGRALIEAAKWTVKGAGLAASAAWRDGAGTRAARESHVHLDATLGWIERAHAATGRKGVARSYVLRRHHRYGIVGWLPAYPETTGYIIPTFYEAARQLQRPDLAAQATAMADWEASIQLEDGAVRGGTVVDPVSPAVFNTGQVLFGWVAAFDETKDARYLDAARRAAHWLVQHLDDDGCWRRGASQFATAGGHVYNARAAWGLALFGARANDAAAQQAAARAADFALKQQFDNGWFADNCLSDPKLPLTHTIAYAAQGVLEIGLLQGEARFVAAARAAARGALAALRADGFLPGRLDRDWRAAVDWSCVTGQAQMALVWDRLFALDGDSSWRDAADRSLRFALSTQDLVNDDGGIRGGVPGSFPIWGGYGSYEYLNWAAKFLADLLLGRLAQAPGGTRG